MNLIGVNVFQQSLIPGYGICINTFYSWSEEQAVKDFYQELQVVKRIDRFALESE